ncbi:hypothetical protein H8356DRAFT_1717234, partial [Neocallimastix lanati (nom. inval.)]
EKYKKFNKLLENYVRFSEKIGEEINKLKPVTFEDALMKNYTEYVSKFIYFNFLSQK